jgi:hypothetical protein
MSIKNNRNPSLTDVIDIGLDRLSLSLRVMLPGRIDSLSNDRKRANIEPLIRSRYIDYSGEQQVEDFPIVPDVPICHLQAGDFFISMPVNVGDNVMMIFCDRSIDQFLSREGGPDAPPTDPLDVRTHTLTDAIAIPMMYPFSSMVGNTSSSNIVIGKNGGSQIHVKADEVALGSEKPSDSVALASKVQAALDAIVRTFNAHTHDVTGTTAVITKTPIVPGQPVASSKVKTD